MPYTSITVIRTGRNTVHSLINNLVYSCSGGDVLMTIVDGKVLYENGQYSTIDIEKTVDMVEKSTREILERL